MYKKHQGRDFWPFIGCDLEWIIASGSVLKMARKLNDPSSEDERQGNGIEGQATAGNNGEIMEIVGYWRANYCYTSAVDILISEKLKLQGSRTLRFQY